MGLQAQYITDLSQRKIKMQKEAQKGDLNRFPSSGYSQMPETGRNWSRRMAAPSSPELLMVSEQTVMWAGWDGW